MTLPAEPPAAPLTLGRPYRTERAQPAGVPALLELPLEQDVRGLCLVFHGAWAAKEGKLGIYSALTLQGMAVVLLDGALHGERQGETPGGLGAREYVWASVRRSTEEMPDVLDALQERFGAGVVWAVGSSMGGYVVQALAQREERLTRAAALITSGVWNEPEVCRGPERAFIEAHRPVAHAARATRTALLLGSADSDPVFPLDRHHRPTAAAYRAAYAAAAGTFAEWTTAGGVGHYTSVGLRDRALAFLTDSRPAAQASGGPPDTSG